MAIEGRLPDFLIIGAAKSGTSFLFELLLSHPDVAFKRNPNKPPENDKEIHFFDARAYQRKGIKWYKSCFPFDDAVRTGEATPLYLYDPRVPRRVHEHITGIRLLAVLRDPVERAFSEYRHRVRQGLEDLSFEEAIRVESKRIAGEREKMLADETYQSPELVHHSYLARGIYVDQLKEWRRFFPEEQLLMLSSVDLFADPRREAANVFRFLGLKPHEIEVPSAQNMAPEPASMRWSTRLRLRWFFAPHNRRLYDYLGRDFGW